MKKEVNELVIMIRREFKKGEGFLAFKRKFQRTLCS